MVISDVNAVLDLVSKAASFYTQSKDGWYKGCSEVEDFGDKVLMLSAKHSQWSEQVRRYGISEERHLLLLVKLAEQALEKQQQLRRKLETSLFGRLQKRVFPGELSNLLDKVLQIVDAGPELLATRLANIDLLEKYAALTPAILPFGRDKNYVPIETTIMMVQRALESAEAARIVTLHGGPGMGKSSLVKHLAIHFVEEKKKLQMDPSPEKQAVFPDGVYYLLCGRQADKRIRQLQLELLQSLGFNSVETAPIDKAISSAVQADYTPLPSLQMKLRSCLAEQKLLIILDDVWEETVLQEVLVPANGVKYLITSQRRDIFLPAEKINISSPTHVEARRIMANYTDGLPMPGQFPRNIQTVTDKIIQKLEHHPLSLANIGISINRSRATDTDQWEVISANLYLHLDEDDLRRPLAYDRAYILPVGASMMLMVDSLPPEAEQLLFLMTLLGGQRLPEPLVKFFYRFIQKTSFAVKYNHQQKFLEDKSLIENLRHGENRSSLHCHSLRSRYIRDKKTHEVRSLGSHILAASCSQDVAMPIEKGDTDETLVTVLGGIYYDPVFKDIIKGKFENHVKILNGGNIPRSLNMRTDTTDHVKRQTQTLLWLLNVDHEEGGWKKQAHEYAKKIIIKFACQGKLDDGNMANLLKHPQTTSIACKAMIMMRYCHEKDFDAHNITFSSVYHEIMETLLTLLHDNGISTERRATVMNTLLDTLLYESKDGILEVGAQYRAALAMESKPIGQVAMMNILRYTDCRGFCILVGSAGLLEDLLGVLLFGKNNLVRQTAGYSILRIVGTVSRLTLRVADFPQALQLLFDLFLSKNVCVSEDLCVAHDPLPDIAGIVLISISIVPENRIKFKKIQGIWEFLEAILVKLEGAWRNTRGHTRQALVQWGSIVAVIIGNLGLEKDLRDTIAALPGVREGLLFLQTAVLSEARVACNLRGRCFTSCPLVPFRRTLTILYSNVNRAIPSSMNLQPVEEVSEPTPTFDTSPDCGSIGGQTFMLEISKFGMYWSEVLAFIQMGSYVESLSSLDRAQRHLDNLVAHLGHERCYIDNSLYAGGCIGYDVVRRCRVFLQAMLKDYSKAFQTASTMSNFRTGVLKRLSGDLQGALDDLNIEVSERRKGFSRFVHTLKQLGYVKYLMGNEVGAKEDAEMAQLIMEMTEQEWGIEDVLNPELWDLNKLPVSYLGFSF